MKYVLDSSVALKWVLPEADSVKAIRLRDEYKNGIHELLAPDIFTPEINHAGTGRAKDWRRTRGAFTGDNLMKQIFEEGRKIRDAERKGAQPRRGKKRPAHS